MEGYPPTPALDKMIAVKDESQVIGEFLNWLFYDRAGGSYCLARWEEHGEGLWRTESLEAVDASIEQLLASYFEIDTAQCNAEREAVLAHVRAQGEAAA